jgi:hypothetical protein
LKERLGAASPWKRSASAMHEALLFARAGRDHAIIMHEWVQE